MSCSLASAETCQLVNFLNIRQEDLCNTIALNKSNNTKKISESISEILMTEYQNAFELEYKKKIVRLSTVRTMTFHCNFHHVHTAAT